MTEDEFDKADLAPDADEPGDGLDEEVAELAASSTDEILPDHIDKEG